MYAETHMQMLIAALFLISPKVETTQMPITSWVDKYNVVCPYIAVLLSHRKKSSSNIHYKVSYLENGIWSERSQIPESHTVWFLLYPGISRRGQSTRMEGGLVIARSWGKWENGVTAGGWGFPGGSVVKNPSTNAGGTVDSGLIPGWGRSPREGNDNPVRYSCLENPVDRGGWQQAKVHGVIRSQTWLSTHSTLTD